jgi:uncharacterized membrane protein YkoI
MNRKRWLTVIVVTLGLAVLAGGAFVAAELWDEHEDERRDLEASQLTQQASDSSLVPVARILELTAQQVPGQVVKVELDDEQGRRVYEIKVLAENGRVRELKFDAHDAQLIEIEDD